MATSVDVVSPSSKPVILVNRFPTFNFTYGHRLLNFTIVDPVSSSISSGPDLDNFLKTHAASARLILCIGPSPLRAEVLSCLPSVECIVTSCAGFDHIDLDVCRRRGIAIANGGDAFSEDVADYAVELLIDVLRKVSAGDRFVRAGLWPERGALSLGNKVGGKRVGIVGLGSIGSLLAKRLLPFGCCIAYNSRKKKVSAPFPYYESIYDLAINSDVLILCCSLTEKTHHIINSNILKALGKNGVIINVGRGALIDENELVHFLVEGKIGGAGLDVFEQEPNVPKELFGLDNVVLSPHKAVLTPESFKALEDVVIRNIEAFFSNQPLLSQVTLNNDE